MQNKQILFCGPIAHIGKYAGGGFSAANRRTIDLLLDRNIDVVEIPYPDSSGLASKLFKLLRYITGFSALLYALIRNIILAKQKDTKPIFHLTGLYKGFIYLEYVLLKVSKLMGAFVIYDIRAGSMFLYYKEKSILYRYFFDKVLKLADEVMVEGEVYSDFVKQRVSKEAYYFPNYIDTTKLIKLQLDERYKTNTIKLLYFGRIARNKGIELIIDVQNKLKQEGFKTILTLIGGGNESYVNSIKSIIADDVDISYSEGLSAEKLMKQIPKYHFYLFPTTHKGEGHSNALTEAMANGVVPICSDNGFNKSVVCSSGIVLPIQAGVIDYYNEISKIWTEGLWQEFSKKSKNRILDNYSSDMVIDNLIGFYKIIK